jgi:dUTP pyrophosphatase
MAGVCDSNYTGEYFVALYNANRVPVVLSKNVKELERGINYIFVPYNKAVAQLAIEYNPIVNIEEVNVEEITSLKTERGDGKLGSSGR